LGGENAGLVPMSKAFHRHESALLLEQLIHQGPVVRRESHGIRKRFMSEALGSMVRIHGRTRFHLAWSEAAPR
jgi:hypothetical protein